MKALLLLKILFFIFSLLETSAQADLPSWSYDAGPSLESDLGLELVDLTATIPNMPEVSNMLMKKQKFRPAFGPIPWRMRLDPDSVKMLFIGQDGTHIDEAAGRPATAGFGGRAQDLAKYFGVNESAAFINTYAFTIKGQYGAYNTPYIYTNNDADPGQVNQFVAGNTYKYSRANIGPEYYDFGTPGSRMVPVSTALRMRGKAHVIVFGTRDRVKFDTDKIEEMTFASVAEEFSDEELFIARPRSEDLRYIFDSGPGEKFAKIMKENLNLKKIFKTKSGMSFKADGIDAYNVKNHPTVADFGHYRGTFKNPKVVILADPIGFDDLITVRALTGERGQNIHRLMKDLGVEDKYLVIKTVPFGMDVATTEEYNIVLSQTEAYRKAIFSEILKNGKPDFIMTDGKFAKKEITKLVAGSGIKVINLTRRASTPKYRFKSAAKKISKLKGYRGVKASTESANPKGVCCLADVKKFIDSLS